MQVKELILERFHLFGVLEKLRENQDGAFSQ
jgi:hypothetical protein